MNHYRLLSNEFVNAVGKVDLLIPFYYLLSWEWKKILLIIFSQCICVVFICATNIVDSIKYEYSEVFDPIRQIDLYYIHKDNYGKGTEILPKYLHTNNVIIDDTIIDTICVQTLVNLQFDTTNVCSGDKINYEILSFGVMFTKPKDIRKELNSDIEKGLTEKEANERLHKNGKNISKE